MKTLLAVVFIGVFVTGPAWAGGHEVVRTDWNGFQREVLARRLAGRTVRITTVAGTEVKTKLKSVAGGGLVVQSTRATTPWASGQKEANIPRDQVRSVRFSGRTGHRGWLGAAVGLGAGAAIAAAVVNGISCDEIGCLVLAAPAVAIPVVGAVGGYLIGRATAPHAPEFVLTQ